MNILDFKGKINQYLVIEDNILFKKRRLEKRSHICEYSQKKLINKATITINL